MTDQTYTLLQLVDHKRDEMLAEGNDPDDLRDITDAYTGILHDFICVPGENEVFQIAHTADGEAFVNWFVHTEDEWELIVRKIEATKAALSVVRKLFGR